MDPPDSKVKVAPGVKSTRSHTAEDPDYQYHKPKTVQIYIYWTSSANNCGAYLRTLAVKAQSMLAPHKLSLRSNLGLPTMVGARDQVIEWTDTISLHDHKEQIMDLSQKVLETPADGLPVILTTITTAGDNGEMINHKGRPFVLIYGNNAAPDAVTLLHEIGHAAGLKHVPWGLARPDKRYNFMATPNDFAAGSAELAQTKDPPFFRNSMFRPDVKALAEAKFTVDNGVCVFPNFDGMR